MKARRTCSERGYAVRFASFSFSPNVIDMTFLIGLVNSI